MEPTVHTTGTALCIALCGLRQCVVATIHHLHLAGFVLVDSCWQPLPVLARPSDQVSMLANRQY